MDHDLTAEDEGKDVLNYAGERIGIVSSVRDGTAYVDPNPDLTDRLRSRLGWDNVDQEDYRLDGDQIASVTDDEIHLESDL